MKTKNVRQFDVVPSAFILDLYDLVKGKRIVAGSPASKLVEFVDEYRDILEATKTDPKEPTLDQTIGEMIQSINELYRYLEKSVFYGSTTMIAAGWRYKKMMTAFELLLLAYHIAPTDAAKYRARIRFLELFPKPRNHANN